jgi:hypothetical protein
MTKMETCKKIFKNFDLIDFAVPIIDLLAPIKYSPNQNMITDIFYMSD